MKKALLKSAFRDVTGSKSRFISIFSIVAIGISFFTGLRATAPDMKLSADVYFDNARLMDFRIVSTVGFDEDDINALEKVSSDNGAIVYPAYFFDALTEIEGSDSAVRILSLPKNNEMPLNNFDIVSGRLPEAKNECIIGIGGFRTELESGQTITVKSGTSDKDINEILENLEYTVVGTYNTPLFIDKSNRGSTSVGSGEINSVIYIPEENFKIEYYTEVYLGFDELARQDCYSAGYEEKQDSIAEKLKTTGSERQVSRYNEIIADANMEINEAEQELNENKIKAETEISEGEIELEKAFAELEDARILLEEGRAELDNAFNEINENEQKLSNTYDEGIARFEKEIQDGEKAIAENRERLNNAEAEYQSGLVLFNENLALYEESEKQYNEEKKAFDLSQAEFNVKENEFFKAREEFKKAFEEYTNNMIKLDAAQNELITLEEKADEAALVYGKESAEYIKLFELFEKSQFEYANAKIEIQAVGEKLSAEKLVLNEVESQLDIARKPLTDAGKLLEQGKAELDLNKEKIENARVLLLETKVQIDEGFRQLEQGEKLLEESRAFGQKELDSALEEINSGYRELDEAKLLLETEREKWEKGKEDYDRGILEYNEALAEFENRKNEALVKIKEAETEISKARRKVSELENPKWYIFDRSGNPGYHEYSENSDRIRNISQVFPVFFILVAALVCFTTMQRMVEENRLQIGTLKALGYKNSQIIFKYMLYALLSSVLGAVAGILFGMKLFPYVIMKAYGILYTIPVIEMPYDLTIAIFAVLAVIAIIAATVVSACYSELKEQPSQLMRPKPPKNGKRILLEKAGFIWKRLSFSHKVSLRNIFRYKRRMLMTVVGISGCTALLLTGFALMDSIGDIVQNQFGEIMRYTGLIAVNDNITAEEAEIINAVFEENNTGFMKVYQKQHDITANGRTISAYVCVAENEEKFDNYISLRGRTDKQKLNLDNGAVLTEKASTLLKLKSGESLNLAVSDTNSVELEISGITENYAYHYVYINKNDFERYFNEKPEYNLYYFKNNLSGEENDSLAQKLLENDFVLSARFNNNIAESFDKMLGALNMVIILIIVSAGGLAFVVLYNLTNININERVREIATLKVLGFYDSEVDKYIFRENILMSLIGDMAGLVLGVFLAQFVIQSAEIDMAMFGRVIHPFSFVVSAVLTLLFSVTVTFSMHFKLIKVDMAQSLKSVE